MNNSIDLTVKTDTMELEEGLRVMAHLASEVSYHLKVIGNACAFAAGRLAKLRADRLATEEASSGT